MSHSTNKRNNANDSNIEVRDFGTSAFDLSYKSKVSGRIGRRQLVGYEFVMPHDRVRVNGHFDFQFMPTSSNMLPAMDMRIEHVFLPWRVVNRDYEDQSSFVDGQAWESLPFAHVHLSDFVNQFSSYIPLRPLSYFASLSYDNLVNVINGIYNSLSAILGNYYLSDYASDLRVHLMRLISGWNSLTTPAKNEILAILFYDCFADFIGEGSYLDSLNAPIITKDVWRSALSSNISASIPEVIEILQKLLCS